MLRIFSRTALMVFMVFVLILGGMPEKIVSAQLEKGSSFRTKINPGPVSIDLSFSQLPELGKTCELIFNTKFNVTGKNFDSSNFKVRAWVEFRWANIYGSYSEAKYGEDVPLEEVLVNGDLTWEGSPFEIDHNLELRGEIKLPREGVWEITGYIQSEGSGRSDKDKRFEEQLRVAVTRDTAVIMGDTWEFEAGPLAYLDNFSYGRLSEKVPNELFDPVVLELDISKIPGIGEEALVTCVISSLYDVTDFTDEISFIRRTDENPYFKIPGDSLLVAGDLKWQGDLKPDEPAEFSATIRLPNDGDWQIYAFGDYPTNERIGFSDNIEMNISGNIRSFGWEERPLKPLPEGIEIQGINPFSNERPSFSRSDSSEHQEQNGVQDAPDSQAPSQPERMTPPILPPPPPITDEVKQSDEGETDQNYLLPPPRSPSEPRLEPEIKNEATRSAEVIPADISSLNEKIQRLVENGARELTDARNEYGRQYQMADGKKRAIISSTPIQYQAADGTYQLIDNTLIPVSDSDKYAFTNSSHSFSVFFPSYLEEGSDILIKTKTGEEIRLGQNTRLGTNNNQGEQKLLQQGNAREGSTNQNTISYPERFNGVIESYTVETWGLKHNYIIERPLILDSADKYIVFTEEVDLPEGSYLSVDGNRQDGDFLTEQNICVSDVEGAFIGVFPSPYAYEGSPGAFDPRNSNMIPLSYEVVYLEENSIQISVLVPVEWMVQPERLYPITIDPSWDTRDGPSHSNDDGYQNSDTTVSLTDAILKVGKNYSSPYYEYATYMRFDEIPIPPDSTIDEVNLWFVSAENYTTSNILTQLKFELVPDAPRPSSYNLPKSRTYGYYSTITDIGGDWDLDDTIGISIYDLSLQEIIDQTGWQTDNAIGLIWATRPGCANDYRTIWSIDSSEQSPYLEIEYTGPDTEDPETLITGGPSGPIDYDDVTFTWTGTDDVTDASDLRYRYYLLGKDSGWSSWTYSTSKSYSNLTERDYTFYVYCEDEAGNTSISAARSFTVDVTDPVPSITSGPSGTIDYDDVTFTWTGTDNMTSTPNLRYSYCLENYDSGFSAWTYNTTKSYSNLPNGEYTFRVTAADQAGNYGIYDSQSFTISSITVTGNWHYRSRDSGAQVPAKNCLVYLTYAGDEPSDYIAYTYTDDNGHFQIGPVSDDEGNGLWLWINAAAWYAEPDLYDTKVFVNEWDIPGPDIPNPGDITADNIVTDAFHYIYSTTIWQDENISAEIYPQSQTDYEKVEAWWIQDDLDRGYRYLFQNDPTHSIWPRGNDGFIIARWDPDGSFFPDTFIENSIYMFPYIYITKDDSESEWVTLHEMGHRVMDVIYGGWYAWYWDSLGDDIEDILAILQYHYMGMAINETMAWTEGWANFWACAVNDTSSVYGYNIEAQTRDNGDDTYWNGQQDVPWENGDTVEGRVAGALWDLYDSVDEPYDEFDGGQQPNRELGNILTALTNQEGDDQDIFAGFWSEYVSLSSLMDPVNHRNAVRALKQNTIFGADYPGLMFKLQTQISGSGTILKNPMPDPVHSNPDYYASGASINLTAVAPYGWQFVSWSGVDSSSDNTAVVTMDEDKTVTANFIQSSIPPSVTTNAASAVTSSGATLNGNLSSLGSASSVNVSFEWGLTTSYGNTTTAQNLSSTGPFSAPLSGLASSTTYYYRARAAGDGTVFGSQMSFTTAAPDVPGAPSDLAASVISASRVDLSWTDNSTNETGFRIERALNDAFTSGLTSFNAAADATSHSDTSVAGNTTYFYRVIAVNPVGDSAASNTASAATSADAATVNISVVLQGDSRPASGWVIPLTVKFFIPGTNVLTGTPVYTFNLTTSQSGSTAIAQCPDILPGAYDITAVSEHTLLNVKRNVTVTLPGVNVSLGTLLEGNANNDDRINIQDFGILSAAFNTQVNDPGYNPMADFDRNGLIDILDAGLLTENYNQISPIEVP